MKNVLSVLLVVYALCLLVWLSGCGQIEPPGAKVQRGSRDSGRIPYVNDSEQYVESIPAPEFSAWLNAHKNVKIIALTGVSNTGLDQNPTTHFWIVYQKLQ